jgi:5-methyltetrahydrofolate--homocysteine methyltransferase
METRLKGSGAEIIISPDRPTVIIGDRIKPSGNSQLAESLRREAMALVRKEAIAQVQEGADVIEVSVGGAGVDEKKVLPLAVQAVAGAMAMPICIDTTDPEALAAALEVCPGKPLVNSITGEERSLKELLPLVKQRGAAVIGLARDEEGIPEGIENRVEMARHVLRQSISAGIPREDVILAPLPLALGDDSSAGMTVLETIARLERIEKVNMTLRVSDVSSGFLQPDVVDELLIGLAVAAGATCLLIDPSKGRQAVLIADVLLGRDVQARRYSQVK